MAQLGDDCFAFGGELTPVAEALDRLSGILAPLAPGESVALDQAAGRILAEPVIARIALPPHDNSAVDGYAVYFDDLSHDAETRLPVVGRAAAGHPFDRRQNRGEAIRIFTGAAMPSGSGAGAPDTVMMQEDCATEGGDVVVRPGIARGANRRHAGEDVMPGRCVLSPGQRLRPQDIGLAAALGRTELVVRAPLRVAVFSTGDEVRNPGPPLEPGAIFDANRYMLLALLRGMGCRVGDLGILPDYRTSIGRALSAAACRHDVIVTSGGVSAGAEDHVRGAVEDLGSIHFWRLAIKPGRPIALGQVGQTAFIGLPGNPVAVMVTFLKIARPILLRLAGATGAPPRMFRVRAGFDYRKKPSRREFVRVRLFNDVDGEAVAQKFDREGAGILSSLVFADGLVELPETTTLVRAGDPVDYLPFSEVIP